jgi:hypothetical protein
MLHCELDYRIVRRRHDLNGKDPGPEDIGPLLLLSSTQQARQSRRIVDLNTVDHRVITGTQARTMIDSAQGEEAIVNRFRWHFRRGGVLHKKQVSILLGVANGFSRGSIYSTIEPI